MEVLSERDSQQDLEKIKFSLNNSLPYELERA